MNYKERLRLIDSEIFSELPSKEQSFIIEMETPTDIFGIARHTHGKNEFSYFRKLEQYNEYIDLPSCSKREYRKKYATVSRIGRILGKLGIKDPQTLDVITKRLLPPELDIRIVSGEDIRKWYNGKSYSERCTGSLDNSCMRYASCQPFFDIYVDHARMVIGTDEHNELHTRAIIWDNLKVVGEDRTINLIDRIYGTDNSIELIKKWARNNGFHHKTEQNFRSNKDITTPDGAETYLKLVFPLANILEYETYPYMDTMSYLESDCLSNSYTRSTIRELDCTDGNRDHEYHCESCEEGLSEDDVYFDPNDGTSYCESCFNENFTYIESTGEYCDSDNAILIGDEYFDEENLPDYIAECENCSELYNTNDTEYDLPYFCPSCEEDEMERIEEEEREAEEQARIEAEQLKLNL
jgi:hypothetical protein